MTIQEKYKFLVSIPGIGEAEMVPQNDNFTIEDKKEPTFGFMRRELTGELRFIDNSKKNLTDFTNLYTFERSGNRCEKVQVNIQVKCTQNGSYQDFYNGYLAMVDGDWDVDHCQVKIKLRPQDQYTCLTEMWDTEFNLLGLEGVNVIEVDLYEGSIEIKECTATEYFEDLPYTSPRVPEGEPSPIPIVDNCIDINEGWTQVAFGRQINRRQDPIEVTYVTAWAREFLAADTSPAGLGWIAVDGGYARLIPEEFINYDFREILGEGGFSVPLPTVTLPNGRYLNDVLIKLFEMVCPGVQLISNFFGINDDASNPDNSYYTFAEENLQEIIAFHKDDLLHLTNSEKATILNVKIKKLMENLVNIFNLEFFELSGNFYLEHASYRNRIYSLDLTQEALQKWIEGKRRYTYNETKLPKYERFSWMEQSDVNGDFDGIPIEYDNACVNDRDAEDKPFLADYTMTNVLALIEAGKDENPKFSDDGIVLVATKDKSVIRSIGALEGDVLFNGPLAWSVLQENLWKYGRPQRRGKMNNQIQEFEGLEKTRKQPNINIHMCCSDYQQFNPEDLVLTSLGLGDVENASYNAKKEILTLNLLHN